MLYTPTLKFNHPSELQTMALEPQRGQWIEVNGTRGRWIGHRNHQIFYVLWNPTGKGARTNQRLHKITLAYKNSPIKRGRRRKRR